jgi:hypothetical protein
MDVEKMLRETFGRVRQINVGVWALHPEYEYPWHIYIRYGTPEFGDPPPLWIVDVERLDKDESLIHGSTKREKFETFDELVAWVVSWKLEHGI